MVLQALAIAIAPGIAIAMLIYALDQREREPMRLLIRCFLLGVLSVGIPLLMQLYAASRGWGASNEHLWQTAIFAFGIVGLSEELGKYIMLRFYAYPKAAFNEPFDGIVYSVMIGMGFATAENIAYVMQYGMGTGLVRMFISVPAHATFAVLMGYYVGLAKFIPQHRRTLQFTGLFWAIVFHGAFDFFLFIGDSIYLMAGSLLSFFIAIRLSIRAIRHHREISARWKKQNYNNGEEYTDQDSSGT